MKKRKVLLVDDDEDDRLIFSNALNSIAKDVEIVEVINGMECIAYLENNNAALPEILFLDLNMPIMNGFQCLKKIKTTANFESIIICIYSTSSTEKDVSFTFANGADMYILKPFSIDNLRRTLEQVFAINWSEHRNTLEKKNFIFSS